MRSRRIASTARLNEATPPSFADSEAISPPKSLVYSSQGACTYRTALTSPGERQLDRQAMWRPRAQRWIGDPSTAAAEKRRFIEGQYRPQH